MAKTCLIATEKPFSVEARDEMVKIMKEGGLEVKVLENYKGNQELEAAMQGVDGVIIRSDLITKEIQAKFPQLQIVIRAGAGTDNVDKEVKTNIVVENTPGQNSQAVAELCIGLAIMMLRKQYNGDTGSEIRGKTVGLMGFGQVPMHLAQTLKGFGVDVCAFDPFVDAETMKSYGVKKVETIQELYKCKIVSLHCPKTAETTKHVNEAMLEGFNGLLINTARAEVVDEEAIIKQFGKSKKFMYVADVAPTMVDEMKAAGGIRYYATSKKLGAQTSEANNNAGTAAARQMVEFLAHGKTMFRVTK